MIDLDKNYFPGWTRKSITFSIDDGNIKMDRKFLDIMNPAGIRGTFNLCSHWFDKMSPEEYRSMYRGHGVANHMKHHPFVMEPDKEYKIAKEPFPGEDKADTAYIYPSSVRGLYTGMTHAWRLIADYDTYLHMIDLGKEDIEAIFGKDTCKDFVWPFSEQKDPRALAYLIAAGYRSVRKTGEVLDSTGFDMPADRFAWSYNVAQYQVLSCAAKYAAYPDDGKLKFFCIGVHSVDYESAGKWNDLKEFAEKFGNRPSEYYSAPVGDLFAYEDAVRSVTVRGNIVINPSDLPVYVKINGKRTVLAPHKFVCVND